MSVVFDAHSDPHGYHRECGQGHIWLNFGEISDVSLDAPESCSEACTMEDSCSYYFWKKDKHQKVAMRNGNCVMFAQNVSETPELTYCLDYGNLCTNNI